MKDKKFVSFQSFALEEGWKGLSLSLSQFSYSLFYSLSLLSLQKSNAYILFLWTKWKKVLISRNAPNWWEASQQEKYEDWSMENFFHA